MKRISSAGRGRWLLGAALPHPRRRRTTRGKRRSSCRRRRRRPSPTRRCSGDVATVKKLIAQGADVNVAAGRRHDRAALGRRARRLGDGERCCSRAHANVKATTRIGSYTPLHIASTTATPAVVRALLKAGARRQSDDDERRDGAASRRRRRQRRRGRRAARQGRGPERARGGVGTDAARLRRRVRSRRRRSRRCSKHGADPSIHTTVVNLTEETRARAGGDEEAERSAHLVRAASATRLGRRGRQAAAHAAQRRPMRGAPRGRRGRRRGDRAPAVGGGGGGAAAAVAREPKRSVHAGADSGGDRLGSRGV